MEPNTLQNIQVTTRSVESYLAAREAYQSLKKRLSLLEEAMKGQEGQLISQIEGGAELATVPYLISIQIIERRFPAWKEEFISRLGKQLADQIHQATRPRIYKSLVVKN